MNSGVYTVKEVMDIIKISKNTAYDLIKQEGFPVIKIKNTYRIPKVAFDEWLNKLTKTA
jgi:excisionase family DNA binding protein